MNSFITKGHTQKTYCFHCVIQKRAEDHKYNLLISQDDKVYLCPGTSTGIRSARNVTVCQSLNEETSKKLPKYDFPTSLLNVTLGVHRIMVKQVCDIDGKQEIKLTEDQTIVFARPKYFVGSGASVWASEYMRLRHEEPHLFQVDQPDTSRPLKSFSVRMSDKINHFIQSTNKKDIANITQSPDCMFRKCEEERVLSFKYHLEAS